MSPEPKEQTLMHSYSFGRRHGAMILEYTGISFIAGTVNHGFFPENRALFTAGLGVVAFALSIL